MSRDPIVKRCRKPRGRATRRTLPLLLCGLLAAPSVALAQQVSPQAVAIVSKKPPEDKRKAKRKAMLKSPALLQPAPAAVPPPILSQNPTTPADKVPDKSNAGQHRPYVEVSGFGLLIGDYQLQPRLVLGTDNRLDDVNIRERVLRDEMDMQEARRRGELRQDPITAWLATRGHSGLPLIDPGRQLAYTIQNVLRGSIRLPPMLTYTPPPPDAYRGTGAGAGAPVPTEKR